MIKNLFRKSIVIVVFLSVCVGLNAQSKEFEIGKNAEVSFATLRELALYYVDSVEVDKLIRIGIDAMLASLDPYTLLIAEDEDEGLRLMTTGSYGGIGALIKKSDKGIIISEVYKNSPADKGGLLCGDTILEVDGMVSGEDVGVVSSRMKGTPGTTVFFKIKRVRTGKVEEIKIERERVHFPNVIYSGMIADSVGYIKLTGFTIGASKEVKEALLALKKDTRMKKLIIDLRGNGGGLMDEAISIVSLFVPEKTEVVSAKGRSKLSDATYFTEEEPIDTTIPLIIMVNSGSASSSEIVAGSLQDLDRATIVGTRTFGKGLVQSIKDVGYNDKLKLTTAKYYTPSGRCVQAIDYSRRNEDGSVGQVPDSLMKEFKTVGGRSVYDGGGVMPDVEIASKIYSRPVLSLIIKDVINEYAIKYFEKHPSIASSSEFSITQDDFNGFIEFAMGKEFDYRTLAEARYDLMLQDAKQEGIYDSMKDELEALGHKIKLSKKEALMVYEKELKMLISEEIVNKYYYQSGRVECIIKNDEQLQKTVNVKPVV